MRRVLRSRSRPGRLPHCQRHHHRAQRGEGGNFDHQSFLQLFLSYEDCDLMFFAPLSQPNFITVRFLKVSSPGSSTLLKHELSTCLLSWSTSGCPCSVRIISFTRFVNLIFTNLIQGYESLLIRLTVSLCSSRTITAKTSLLRQ